jgi:CHAD domain-containing protein
MADDHPTQNDAPVRAPYRGVGAYAHKQVKRLRSRLGGLAGRDEDIEHVHKARVASRRLRSVLKVHAKAFGSKADAWRKQLKGLTKALGQARDTDVQMQTVQAALDDPPDESSLPGLRRLLLRLKQHRQSLEPDVTEKARQLAEDDLLDKIDKKAKALRKGSADDEAEAFYKRSAKAIGPRIEKLRAKAVSLAQPADHKGHHKMRIAAKRLRYALESMDGSYAGRLEEFIGQAKSLQSTLGHMHDHVVFTELLDDFLREELKREQDFFGHAEDFPQIEVGIVRLRQEHLDAHELEYDKAKDLWERQQQEQTWQQLEGLLDDGAPGRGQRLSQEQTA